MDKYHKIQTVFKRDPNNKFKTLLHGEYAKPEFEYLKNNEWVYTEKVDGTNIRVMYDDYIRFAGKTNNALLPEKLFEKLVDIFLPQKETFKSIFDSSVCLYGEGYGSKIQKGGERYRQDQSFVMFDVKIGEWWLSRDSIENIAKKLNIDVVPIIGTGTLIEMVEIAQCGTCSLWGGFEAEGIVARPKVEMKDRSGNRIITKIKYKDFERQ